MKIFNLFTKKFLFCLAMPMIGTAVIIFSILHQNKLIITDDFFTGNVKKIEKYTMCDLMLQEGKVMSLILTGEVTDFSNLPNLLSTAEVNSGIRVEIDTSGGVGIVTKDLTAVDELTGFTAGKIEVGKKFEIEILFRFGKYISARVDKGSWTRIDKEFYPECNKVLLGGGFSPERTTRGNLHVEIGEFVGDIFTEKRNWFIQLGLTLILLGVIFTFRKLDSDLNEVREPDPKLE